MGKTVFLILKKKIKFFQAFSVFLLFHQIFFCEFWQFQRLDFILILIILRVRVFFPIRVNSSSYVFKK